MHSQRQTVTKADSHPLLLLYYRANNVNESSTRVDNGGKAWSLPLVYLCLTVMSMPSEKSGGRYGQSTHYVRFLAISKCKYS